MRLKRGRDIPVFALLLTLPIAQACRTRDSTQAPASGHSFASSIANERRNTVFKRREMSSAMRSVEDPSSAFSTRLQYVSATNPLVQKRRR